MPVKSLSLNGTPLSLQDQADMREQLRALFSRGWRVSENGVYLRGGNSFDEGQGAGTTANSTANLVAAARGFTLTNIAVGGATLADYMQNQFGSRTYTAGDTISATFGLNDLRYYGPDPVRRRQYLRGFQASMAYLAIPDANKVHAGRIVSGATDYNPAVTYAPNTGAWNGAGVVFRGTNAATRALVTSTSGASVSASVTGDAIFIWHGQANGVAGAFVPIVDGVVPAYGSVGTESLADAPGGTGQWMLACTVISGLSSGSHTVQLRSENGAAFVPLAWAGIDTRNFSGCNVYATGIPLMRPAHWAIAPAANAAAQAVSDGQSAWWYENESAQQYNLGMRRICEDLRNNYGLNTRFVDIEHVNWANVPSGNLHQEPMQHIEYARAELAAMARE